jgi:hypothetical protein
MYAVYFDQLLGAHAHVSWSKLCESGIFTSFFVNFRVFSQKRQIRRKCTFKSLEPAFGMSFLNIFLVKNLKINFKNVRLPVS